MNDVATAQTSRFRGTLLWLIWTLTRRRWQRQNKILRVFAIVLTAIALPLTVLLFFTALGVGVLFLPHLELDRIVFIWAVLCSMYIYVRVMGLWISLQQDQGLPMDKLLHLPMAFGRGFAMNFLISQLTFSFLFFAPLFLGLAIACITVFGLMNLPLLLLVAALIFCVSTVIYQFQCWLLSSVSNKQHRIIWAQLLFLSVVMLAQAPNLYSLYSRSQQDAAVDTHPIAKDVDRVEAIESPPSPDQTVESDRLLSKSWTDGWIHTNTNADATAAWRTWLATFVLFAIGGLSLRSSFSSSMARYMDGQSKSRRQGSKSKRWLRREVDRTVIAQSQPLAVCQVTLRSWFRSVPGKMSLLAPLFFIVMLIALGLIYPTILAAKNLPLAMFAVVAIGGLPPALAINMFAFDGLGFRLYLTSGIDMRNVLLGKFLALLAIYTAVGSAISLIFLLLTDIALLRAVGALFQMGVWICVFFFLGVYWSTTYPYAVSVKSMRANGGIAPVVAFLLETLAIAILLITGYVTIHLEDGAGRTPWYLIASLIQFVVVVFVASWLLDRLSSHVNKKASSIVLKLDVQT